MSIVISLLLSPVAVILVIAWANVLGGVSWAEGDAKRVFDLYPVMMVIACVIMNVGALAFRVAGTSSYQAHYLSSSSRSDMTVSSSLPPRRIPTYARLPNVFMHPCGCSVSSWEL